MNLCSNQLLAYITPLFVAEPEVLREARTRSEAAGLPTIHIQPAEGHFLELLVRAAGVRRALEIGTLGGYSGVWIARGLAEGGTLITLEREPRHAAVARETFQRAGLAGRASVREGIALDLLPTLEGDGPWDLLFIDADKEGYPDYWEWAVRHVRAGGLILAHNALGTGSGNVVEGSAAPIQSFNERVAADGRVQATIFPLGQGTLVAVRR